MRQLLLLGSALIASGCAALTEEKVAAPPSPPVDWHSLEPRQGPPPAEMTATAKERAVTAKYAAALSAPAFAGLAPLLDEFAHFTSSLKETHDRENVVAAHAQLFGAFDERRFTVGRVWLTESSQAIEWTMSGVHARDWLGVKATHKPVAFRGLAILFTNDDGSISDIHVYFDLAVVKGQLGVGPAELTALPLASVPTAQPEIFEQSHTPGEAQAVGLVRLEVEALEDGKEAAYLAPLADNVAIQRLDRAQPEIGKAAPHRDYEAMRRAIAELDTIVRNAWGVDRFAVVEYVVTGRQRAPFERLPLQSNHLLTLNFVDIAEIANGKIVRVWRYLDSGAPAR